MVGSTRLTHSGHERRPVRVTTYPLIERRSKAPQQRYAGLSLLGADSGW